MISISGKGGILVVDGLETDCMRILDDVVDDVSKICELGLLALSYSLITLRG